MTSTDTWQLSIIVPVLNEASGMLDLLDHLSPLARAGAEVLIVDGGSEDATVASAEAAGFAVLHSARGRARQMNTGAAHASGRALLFLHADTRLPEQAAMRIADALQDSAHVWGRFDVRIAGCATMLRVIACMMNWRSHWTGIATGDQAMFLSRAAFDAIGGFPDQPLMEDVELSRRLRTLSRPARIVDKVTTSGRRWETRGVWRTIFLMWRLRWAYWRGASAHELAEAYR
ncbi:TIGR04283 family arsenosugar biosynthesis glycosyltransferase [Aromatoleum diolicum]|uniref:Glycosyltransferase n=1 Tax=Aromatoleum diolicum TaxID=75796 RepID=A0ABX1QH83_9RHOO|nr:TIGR04283 family arsenosugar biosynthesis glycosyltransferase [Aromatoleum diolicum]NMG76361.1 glycosyltransferase [Aromatoleum diolicum]